MGEVADIWRMSHIIYRERARLNFLKADAMN
jgi:hypothetical protein